MEYGYKSSSICMTPREDNDEQAFGQIIVRFTFDKFSKRLSLYEYVYVGFGDERLQYNLTFFTDPLCVYRRGEGWVEDRYIRFSTIPVPTVSITSCILDFYVFDNFDSLTQHLRCEVNSFKPCIHFLGHRQMFAYKMFY